MVALTAMFSNLTKKILRDIWRMRAQVAAISLVILSGVAVYIMSLSTLQSLQLTRKIYYQEQLFADIFVGLKRAPIHILESIKAIDGVQTVDARIMAGVNIEVKGFEEPIQGRLISYNEHQAVILNQIYLTKGRYLSAQREGEIIVSDAFAKAHQLNLQDNIDIIINGKKREFTIVGIALSPEYIYQIAPGAIFPDYKRYAIVWISQKAFEHAYDMDGAFNFLSLKLLPEISDKEVIQNLDLILKPYGGLGAYARKDQLSDRFLQEEFKQLNNMAIMFPIIFFGVAGFLLNLVMMRLVQTEREQIAILKAFGYGNWQVTWLYLRMVMIIVSIGIILGIAVGAWMGKALSELYTEFYKFPFLIYKLDLNVVASSILICFTLACLGVYFAIKEAYKLMPAEGMRPAPPGVYKKSWLENVKVFSKATYSARMIYRNIERRPIKALMTTLGIAFATAILMVGSFQEAALDHMIDVQFNLNQKEDIQVAFNEPVSHGALYSLMGLEGVRYVEGQRQVPVRLKFEQREYLSTLQAINNNQHLRQILDLDLKPIKIPENGVVMSDYFRTLLGVKVGDQITVEVLEGKKAIKTIQISGFVQEYMGLGVYISFDNMYRLLQEGPSLNGAVLSVFSDEKEKVFTALKNMPAVSGITFRENAIKNFFETLGDTVLIFTFFISLFGGALAFGLVFNNATISLSEKNRELSTLRVIGLSEWEVTGILLGELAILTLVAIPVGFVIGTLLCKILSVSLQSELYRVPLILNKTSFAYSCLIVLIASLFSSVFLVRKIKKLDMIASLKAKE